MSASARSGGRGPGRMLKAAGLRPWKAQGQNFLIQRQIAQRIVECAEIKPHDRVIEVGPGLGMLTQRLLEAGPRQLMAVEKDRRLAALLALRYADNPRITVLDRDFLSLAPRELNGAAVKVVGNLPFSVATAILRHLTECQASITRMVLMFQREVAERIRARPGTPAYGALSVLTRLNWQIGGHFRVGAGNFYPRPKVEAEVLIMEPQPECAFSPGEAGEINATVRAAFSAPRKTIRNSLIGGLGMASGEVEDALARAAIPASARPARLDCTQLIALARALKSLPEPRVGRA